MTAIDPQICILCKKETNHPIMINNSGPYCQKCSEGWWCESCQEIVPGIEVTFEEVHTECCNPVS